MNDLNGINNLRNQRFVNPIQPPSNIAVDLYFTNFMPKRQKSPFFGKKADFPD